MRRAVNSQRIREFAEQLGRRATGPGRVYFVGGACALLVGWRESTIDINLALDPEPRGVFEAIAQLKNELEVNVELAAPHDFLPALPDWRENSPFLLRSGPVDFFHYDFRAQALAKIARGHDRDQGDVAAMLARGLVTAADLRLGLATMRPQLIRFPALDEAAFVERVLAVAGADV